MIHLITLPSMITQHHEIRQSFVSMTPRPSVSWRRTSTDGDWKLSWRWDINQWNFAYKYTILWYKWSLGIWSFGYNQFSLTIGGNFNILQKKFKIKNVFESVIALYQFLLTRNYLNRISDWCLGLAKLLPKFRM